MFFLMNSLFKMPGQITLLFPTSFGRVCTSVLPAMHRTLLTCQQTNNTKAVQYDYVYICPWLFV